MKNLRELVHTLRNEKDLIKVEAPVDPVLEIAEIHRRVIDEEGPALLFTNVKGSDFPVVTNLFGTSRRVELAFGPRPEQLTRHIADSVHSLLPPKLSQLWKERGLLKDLARIGTKRIDPANAPVLQVQRDQNPLSGLPVLTCWQEDGGPFVTLPLVYTEHPQDQSHNLGMYRMQIHDDSTTGMHWQIHKGGGFHYHEAERMNQPLPVTVFLGGPPALIASAIAPLPEQVPELLLASLILGGKLPVTEDPAGGHRLIAEAEFAISGFVPPHTRRAEGPFGDHYGYYSLTHDFPIFQVDRLRHRKDAIYPATIVGKPRQEDYYLGEFLQRLLSPAFPLTLSGVKDLWTYAETGFHPLASAVVRESYSREALATAFRILGEGQLTLTKVLLLTDKPVNLADFKALMVTILERFNPSTDLLIVNQTSHDTLDYTGGQLNHGSKAVLLGVGEPIRELPAYYDGGPIPGITEVAVYCSGCLVVHGADYASEPDLPARILETSAECLRSWPLVIIVDSTEIVNTQTSFLWTVFTRFNPASDIHARFETKQHHFHYELPLIIDARMKPGYPEELEPRADIVEQVDRRWREYFPNGLKG